MNIDKKTQKLVLTAVLTAVLIVMASVPVLGYIPLGIINATILHVPVIIGAILLGPVSGGFLGFVFGLTSLVKNTTTPNATSFVFSPFIQVGEFGGDFRSLIICMIPRILIGIVAYYVYKGVTRAVKDKKKGEAVGLVLAGIAGSMTNTLLVMNLIYLFFGQAYAAATGRAYEFLYAAILTIIGTSGIGEAVVAAILTVAICKVMMRFMKTKSAL
ncbi:MAG: ECF transporter S component [Lachnospiraceae bacterium]|nr:ECF transporter S component [Lachnospiraceae bacterium]